MTVHPIRRYALLLLVVLAALGAAGSRARAAPLGQDPVTGQQTYQSLCTSCHTIGKGKLVGPDLAGVTERRDAEWLKRFILEPDKVLAAGDPVATELLAAHNNVPMPNLGLTARQVEDIVAYLRAPEAVPAGPAGNAGVPAGAPGAAALGRPAPAAGGRAAPMSGYAPYGEMLFTGEVPLQGGGTPCIACHSVEGVGVLGGGSLGPDLTQVYTRYGGPGLTAALGTLPFPTMQSIFATRQLTPQEQADLLAFFARSAYQPTPGPLSRLPLVLGGGAGLAGGLFLGMLFFWPRQRMGMAQRLRSKGRLPDRTGRIS